MIKKYTTEHIIKLSKEYHGDRYLYDKTLYVDSRTLLIVTCKIHGDFSLLAKQHYSDGRHCPICMLDNKKDKSSIISNIIQSFNILHKNQYDYSNFTKYTGVYQQITVFCHKHGEFNVQIKSHKNGIGCQKCKHGTLEDILLLFKNKYGYRDLYEKVNYVNMNREVIITCRTHGDFSRTPNQYLRNTISCTKCNDEKTYKQEYAINRMTNIHDNKYDYSKSIIIGAHDKILINCHMHGDFYQSAHNHIGGAGCQQCAKTSSIQERQVLEYIKSFEILNISTNTRSVISPNELDIYIPEHQIAIEYNGLYWHSDEKKSSTYHLDKTNKCKEKGIRLIHIFEDEWINKQQIVKSRLSNIFNKTTNRIWARKCIIKDVTSSEAKQFLELNHIQGHAPGRHKIGLYYEDELVALMTFCNLRKSVGSKHVDGSYELLRYCNKLDHTVIGGASRLLKNFIKTNKPQQIISYSDKRWSVGNMYKQLGFVHVHDSPPNYFYIIDGQRKHRYGYRKDLLVAAGYDKAMTEREIMQSRGIRRIYDSGASKWLLTLLN